MTAVLQPGSGDRPGDHYLPATPANVLWGRLPCAAEAPVVRVASGDRVTCDTVSHEGLLPDQGSDPVAYLAAHGMPRHEVLDDAVAIAAQLSRDTEHDGPHVVTGPVHVEDARPCDLLRPGVERLIPRVSCGVTSNRRGRGALPGDLPREGAAVSVFAPVVERDGAAVGTLPLVDGGPRVVTFPLRPRPVVGSLTPARARCG